MNHATTTALEKMPESYSFNLSEHSILRKSFYEARLAYLLAQGVFGVELECSGRIAPLSPLDDLVDKESDERTQGHTSHEEEGRGTAISCPLRLPRTIRRMPKLQLKIPETALHTSTTVPHKKRVTFVDEPIDLLRQVTPAKRAMVLSGPPKSALKRVSAYKPTKVIPTLPELAFEIDDEGNPMFAGGKINFVERMIDRLEEFQQKQRSKP